MRNQIGNNYQATKDLDIKDIAKLIRKDITAQKKSGNLPQGLKTSVRIDRFAGGQALRLEIISVGDTTIYSEKAIDVIKTTGDLYELAPDETYSDEYKNTKDVLTQIHNSYNYDNSDIMTDYFDTRYYGRVETDYDLRNEQKAKILN